MNRLRRWSVLICLIALAATPFSVRGADKPAEKWLLDRSLTVAPAAAPVPVFRYRLYPSSMERKEGNAVPIYLRFAHERSDERKKQLLEKPVEWNKLPLDRLPLGEVKKFLQGQDYNLRQFDLAARRKKAEWEYTLDAGNPIQLLIPDVQEMRMYAPLLVLKARVEIAEGRYADAIRILETGFSFAQQVSEGPTLIHGLVGIVIATQMADCLLELIERTDAPDLYWALTAIPRPLIDLRHAFEFEHQLLELQFPDMAELDRPRGPEHWDAALKRVRLEIERITRMERGDRASPGNGPSDPAGKSPDLSAARKYLVEVAGMKPAAIDAMPPAQVLLLYISHYYHEFRDDIFKSAYLPYPQARPLSEQAHARLKALAVHTDAERLVRMFLPAVMKVQVAEVRIARKLAALRAIEALRIHAAAHDGALPDRLDEVKDVPVPDDPGTGRPFEYRRDGATATLTSRLPGQPLETSGLRYRITIRK